MQEIIYKVAISLPAFLIALVFHEAAHAWMANRFGDQTAKSYGRMTLNPAPHIDIFGTIIFPIIGIATGGILFGWAKPVPVDSRQFKNIRLGIFWVSFAGPLINIILGFFFSFLFILFLLHVPTDFYLYKPLAEIFRQTVVINLVLAVFNLIPIPPLDGSKMAMAYLPYDLSRKVEMVEPYGFFILIALLMSGAMSYILMPAWVLSEFFIGTFYRILM